MSYHDDNNGDDIDMFYFQGGDSVAVMGSTAGVQSVSTTGTTSELMTRGIQSSY